ncbi:LCP family protein [Gracilibacillus sp. S3-1-1]|uniref:LCP family protein n=1 Tax=Gracilibacillus pellucidus TaxID=3095368 RepID=A0ACC6M4J2_9BACI|nr:LCP family protein [Gracilibacillus sp. S3-1-1]MDX8045817.1 LCP family protein [Gracilibacillus sp. S3-1-1]
MSAKRRSDRKKTSRWKKGLLWTLLLVIVAVVSYSIYFIGNVYQATNEAYDEIDRPNGKSELRETDVAITKDPISILLMGIEDYETDGQNGRADTQILATLNPHTNKMTMTTIPRDTITEFTEEEAGQYAGTHKLNAAYTYGSITDYGEVKLQVEKVEDLLGIPIDEYVAVNFDGFRDIVDALGGVSIDIKEPFWEKNFYVPGEKVHFEQGVSKLNGEEALAFVRMRKQAANANYSREERQRQFIESTIDQAISTNTLFKVGEISNILGQNVSTSFSPSEIFHMQQTYSSIDTSNIETFEVGGQDEVINGIWYFNPDPNSIDELANQLRQELELPLEDNTTSTVEY